MDHRTPQESAPLRKLTTLGSLVSIAAAFAVAAPGAQAAESYHLKVDGINGESTSIGGYIDVDAFTWGASTSATAELGGMRPGKASLSSLTIEKRVDSTTPALFQTLGAGTPIAALDLVARRAGAPRAHLRYCLTNVVVTSQKQEGSSGDEGARESVSFAYGAMIQQYTRTNVAGAPIAPPTAGSWSVITGSLFRDTLPGICRAAV